MLWFMKKHITAWYNLLNHQGFVIAKVILMIDDVL